MRALVLTHHGGIAALQVQDVPAPAIAAPDQVLIRMTTAALNHLDLFLTELKQPVLITLPKVVSVAQVKLFVSMLTELEHKLGFAAKSLRIEFMIEAAQGLVDAEGRHLLPQLHRAADGRLQAAHFGTYDYTASLDITAALQSMQHPACDLAKSYMKLAFAGTGVFLSDGATTQLPSHCCACDAAPGPLHWYSVLAAPWLTLSPAQ